MCLSTHFELGQPLKVDYRHFKWLLLQSTTVPKPKGANIFSSIIASIKSI